MKMMAPMSGEPTREIELLIADATPEKRPDTELMRVVVSGATTHEIPAPNSRIAGRTSTKTLGGGISVAGSEIVASHGAESAGRRAHQSRPVAMINGPATRKRRAPMRPATVPIRVDRSDSMSPLGMPTAPAASAV